MRALVQRTAEASVCVDGDVIGSIGRGLCVLVGVTHTDDESAAGRLADKVWKLRIFEDNDGKMNRAVAAVGGEILVISQFTLYGDARKGNRPSFVDAARPEHAAPLVDRVVMRLEELGATVATGAFGAEMQVTLVNDGPVTLMIET